MKKPQARALALGAAVALLLSMIVAFAPAPVSAAGSAIVTRSHLCPATFDGTGASIYDLTVNCQKPAAGVRVAFSQDAKTLGTASTRADGTLTYAGFTGGQVTIAEAAPAGTLVRAFCAAYAGSAAGARLYYEYANPISFALPHYQSFDCDLYTVQAASPALSSLRIVRHLCPAGYDAFGGGIADLTTACGTEGNASFVLKDAQDSTLTATGVNGTVAWANLPRAGVSVRESSPGAYLAERAFCTFQNTAGTETGPFIYSLVSGKMNLDLESGNPLTCDWFDVATTPGADAPGAVSFKNLSAALSSDIVVVAATPAATGSTIYLNKHNCPTGAYAYDIATLAATCHESGTDGVSFTLTDGANGSTAFETKNGMVAFPNLPAGGYLVTESFPTGYVSAVVFCDIKAASGNESGYTQYDAQGGKLNLMVKDGFDILCDWYDLPPMAVSVQIRKYDCPAGVDPTAASESKRSDQTPVCQPAPNVTFALHDSSLTADPAAITTDPTGAVAWTGLPSGDIQIRETLPTGYADPVVVCSIGLAENQPGVNPLKVSNGATAPTIAFSLTPGERAECAWYNIAAPPATPTAPTGKTGGPKPTPVPTKTANPAKTASFALTVFTCKAGYNVFASTARPGADCTAVSKDVQFSFSGPNKFSAKQKTTAAGRTAFSGLNAGEYTLTEIFPAGVTSAFINTCTSNLRGFNDYPFTPFARVGTSGKLNVNLLPGEQLSCAWYDVPSKSTPASPTPAAGATTNRALGLEEERPFARW